MTVNRIETTLKSEFPDPVALSILARAKSEGLTDITGVRKANVFKLKGNIEKTDLEKIAAALFADSVTETYSINSPVLEKNNGVKIEIAFNAGVMDPVEASAKKALRELGVNGIEGVKTGTVYLFEGKIDKDDINLFASRNLYNKVVQHIVIDGENPFPQSTPYQFSLVTVKISGLSDEELLRLSQNRLLSLNLDEMKTIQKYFLSENREPTDVELETIAQTWSEHCRHKTFRATFEFDGETIQNLLKSTIMKATRDLNLPWCVSVFSDNAGIIEFDEQFDVCFKVETHNHPSALEPYGGAGTGIGGVIRDILGTGLGAKPVANTDIFCFAPPDTAHESLPSGTLHPKRIMEGVVSGVRDYGNRMGIPTVNGAICFHPAYVGNPLVFCGTVGIIPKGMDKKAAIPGDFIVAIGGRTGRDGIHGATFSSIELNDASEVTSSGAVQIGNPIEEKRFMDAMLIARDRRLYNAVTDCGAGGFSSAIGEMGEKVGAEVHLERAPLKYEGLAPWEIWVSEAQERMILAVPPDKWDEFKSIMDAWDVECVNLGTFTGDRRLRIFYEANNVCDISMEFLHDGIPQAFRKAFWRQPTSKEPEIRKLTKSHSPGEILHKVLSHLDVASKEWVIRQYDHEVQGASAIKPLLGIANDGPSDATVLRPRLDSNKGIAIANGINVRYGSINPFHMAQAVIDEAMRNIVAVGGNPDKTAILDNFAWGSSNNPERMGELVMASKACYESAMAYGTPFISGKDSFNNEYRSGDNLISVPPTLLISAISVIDNIEKCATMDAKAPGDHLFILGITDAHLGGSVIFDLFNTLGNSVPVTNLKTAPETFRKLHQAIQTGYVKACHDISDGGLAACIAEMCFSGGMGCIVDLEKIPQTANLSPQALLYSETPSRFLVEIPSENAPDFEKLMENIPHAKIGTFTQSDRLIVWSEWKKEYINESIWDLKKSWQTPLGW